MVDPFTIHSKGHHKRNYLILMVFICRICRMKLRTFNNQQGIALGPILSIIAIPAVIAAMAPGPSGFPRRCFRLVRSRDPATSRVIN
jgi:hypothetical protein